MSTSSDKSWHTADALKQRLRAVQAERDALQSKLEKIGKICRRPVINDWSMQAHDAEMAARVDEIEDVIEEDTNEAQ